MTQPPTFDEFHEPSLFDVDRSSTDEPPTPEIDYDQALGELADLVDDIFRTWFGDGEAKWAAQAFLALRRQGLVEEDETLDHTRNVVLLCAIWALSKEFYVRAFEEGSGDDWTYGIPDVFGEFPKLSELNIGRLAEREGVVADTEYGDETPSGVLKELIREFAPAVATALAAEFKDTWLFPYMWAIPSGEVSYPLPDEHAAWGMLSDPSGNAIDAYMWISQGMPL